MRQGSSIRILHPFPQSESSVTFERALRLREHLKDCQPPSYIINAVSMDQTSTPTASQQDRQQPTHPGTANNVPTSATKHCMSNNDIVTTIFSHFIPEVPHTPAEASRPSNEGRKQLLALAKACQAFSDPALTCLWSYICDLAPLFRILKYTKEYDGSWVCQSAAFAGLR